MATKRILSWAPNHNRAGGRWKKQINRRVYFFGHASTPRDTKSYKLAEKKYLGYLAKIESHKPAEIKISNASVEDVINKYLQMLHDRYLRDEVSSGHFDKSRWTLNYFANWAGSNKKFAQITEIDIEEYKSHCLNRMIVESSNSKKITRSTVKGMLTTLKTMFKWGWKVRLIEHLPRNIDDITKMPSRNICLDPDIKIYSANEIQTLWNNAVSRTKCFIALALNAGMGQQDISDLRYNEIDWQNGYIHRNRSKTNVEASHKLWKVTLELLKQHRQPNSRGNDRIFLTNIIKPQNSDDTRQPEPLLRTRIINGKLTKADAVRNMFFRLQKKTGINGSRGFYCLRKTGASLIEKIDPLTTEMFLAHSEKSMKRNYAQRDWARLDKALLKMEHVLDLKV